jgi:Holliday junction DNA helicase RuvA
MIGRLRGKILEPDTDGAMLLDVGGVGYELFVPLGAAGRADVDADGSVTFHVHTHVREEIFALYGFPSAEERAAFRVLLGVSSIGPKTALGVLSALPIADLARAVAAKDLKVLTAVSGIGKKTAEMMLVQLRDKLPMGDVRAPPVPAKALSGGKPEMLVSALAGLGYRAADAERAVASLGEERLQKGTIQELLREVLAVLAK